MNFTVYRSSAGSGKTYTLVKEYLKIALATQQPDRYRHILAITFTNKAANEMKERVIGSLRDLAGDEPPTGTSAYLMLDIMDELDLPPEFLKARAAKTLEHILHHYADFSISTIDKFVYRVVRSFAHDLSLPQNFEVELDGDLLLTNAIDLLIDSAGNDEQLTKALVEFTEAKAAEERSWHIEHDLLAFAQHLLKDDGRAHLTQLRQLKMEDFFRIRKDLQKQIAVFEKTLQPMGEKALELLHNAGVEPSMMAGGKNGIAKYFEYLATLRVDKLKPSNTVGKNVEAGKWYAGKADADAKSRIDSVRDDLETIFHEAVIYAEDHLSEYILNRLVLRNMYVLAVLNELEGLLEEFRTEQNLIHISEFNRRIAQIVAHEPAPFIYERLGERYRHFLIDEFQDTSVLQWQNLLPLFENSLAGGHFNLLVGDGKQSIYRWRGGEVEQFARLPHLPLADPNPFNKEREGLLERNFQVKRLQNNFRSRVNIVEFNNYFFRELASTLDERFQDIYEDLEQIPLDHKTGGGISIEVMEPTEETDLYTTTLQRIEELIREATEAGFRWRDITILCRRNGEASLVAQYLLDIGIDVISSESLIIGQSQKVQLLEALMAYLNDMPHRIPQSDVILRLHRMGLVQEDVIEDLQRLNVDPASFALDNWLRERGFSDFDPDALLALPVFDLAAELVRQFGLDRDQNPHVAFFLEAVFHYASRKDGHLTGFLEWWADERGKRSIILPEGTEAVQLMTIHKAKGLEFPVVIFPFANWKVRSGKDQLWVDLEGEGDDLPATLLPVTKQLESTPFAALYAEEMNKTWLDNFNVLYVAFTRAVDRLHVLTSQESAKDLSKKFLPFLEGEEGWQEDPPGFFTGDFGLAQDLKEPEEAEPLSLFSPDQSGNWRDRLSIALSAPNGWDTEHPDAPHRYGQLMHEALARSQGDQSVSEVLDELVEQGWLPPDERPGFEMRLERLLSTPEVARLFLSFADDVRIESEILLANGRTYRPDRVMITRDQAQVVDFKTGQPREEDRKQVDWYAKLLGEMGYKKVEKYLVYTESATVESW